MIFPYRHPLHTARLTANLDWLSGERFVFGVGWAKQEFEALGVPFEPRGAVSHDYDALANKDFRYLTCQKAG